MGRRWWCDYIHHLGHRNNVKNGGAMAWTFYNASGEAMYIDGGMSNVVEDTTPQLGGNLDMQARLLVGNGGSTGIAISSVGEVTMAAQPAFMARNNGTIANVTGDGTPYTLVFATQVFDQNADWDDSGNTTFTAPVAGKYRLSFRIMMSGLLDTHTEITMAIVVNSVNSMGNYTNGITRSASTNLGFDGSGLFQMGAGEAATVVITVTNGAKVVDFSGASDLRSNFSGELVA
jgi:hypothetical protein